MQRRAPELDAEVIEAPWACAGTCLLAVAVTWASGAHDLSISEDG